MKKGTRGKITLFLLASADCCARIFDTPVKIYTCEVEDAETKLLIL